MSDLTDTEIRRGVSAARDFTGFFSLPAFRELCKTIDTEQLGLPAVRAAYEEACRAPSPKVKHRWSHPAVYQAGVATGWLEMHSMPTDQIFPRFKYHYEQLVKRVMSGEDITVPVPEALPEKINSPLTPEQRVSRMASLRETVGL